MSDYLRKQISEFDKMQSIGAGMFSFSCEPQIVVPQSGFTLTFEEKQKLTTEQLFGILAEYTTPDMLDNFSFRNVFTKIIGWSISSPGSLEAAIEFLAGDNVLEIAAGLGFWSALFRSKNVVVHTSTIVEERFYNQEQMQLDIWTHIESLDCVDAVKKYPDNCLFLSWGWQVLDKVLPEFKGNKLIIIGENVQEVTDFLDTDETNQFELVKSVRIPQFSCMKDIMRFYIRK